MVYSGKLEISINLSLGKNRRFLDNYYIPRMSTFNTKTCDFMIHTIRGLINKILLVENAL